MLTREQQWLIVIAIMVICLAPFWIVSTSVEGEFFTGADGQAERIVEAVSPSYQPWASSAWKPPGGEIESLLFALQAALGAGVIGYYLGFNHKKSKDEL